MNLFARVRIDFMQRIKIKYFHSEQMSVSEFEKSKKIVVFKFPNRKFKSIWWMPWL